MRLSLHTLVRLAVPQLVVLMGACGQPVRRSDITVSDGRAVRGLINLSAPKVAKHAGHATLPPPTMSTSEIRQAMWDIAARQMRGDIARVLAEYQEKAAAEPNSLEVRFLAAMAIADDDERWRALYALSEDYPKYPWAHAGMASVYARWKIRDQCEKEVNLSLEYGPDILWAYTVRGDLYRWIGENELAVRDYAVALRGDPTDADARVGLALARRALGQTDGLRDALEQALRDVPTHYEAAENLALLLDDHGDPQALSAWERLGDLAPRNRTAQLAIARLCAASDPARAAAAYEKAAKTGPLTKTQELALAQLYHRLNRPSDEIHALQVVSRLDPKDVKSLQRIAELYIQKNDWSNAEQTFESVLMLTPNDPAAFLGMGQAYEKRAQLRKAIEYYRRALAAGGTSAKTDLARLDSECMLSSRPITGRNYDEFYAHVMDSLQKIYARRLEDAPRLKGELKLRVETDGNGNILDLEVTQDTLNDPWIEAHLYYSVFDSKFPPFATKRFVMPFTLDASKQ